MININTNKINRQVLQHVQNLLISASSNLNITSRMINPFSISTSSIYLQYRRMCIWCKCVQDIENKICIDCGVILDCTENVYDIRRII